MDGLDSTSFNEIKDQLKKWIFELIRTDEEFRMAIASATGYYELFMEIKKLREDFNRMYNEFSKRFEEIEKRFEEINKRFEEIERRFEEINKRFEEVNKRFEEVNERFEFIEKKLESHDKILMELVSRVNRIELEVGALSESFYTRSVFEDLVAEVERLGETIEYRERNARVDDEDIDLLIVASSRVYVVEVKIQPKHRDVGALLAKSDLVKKRYGDKEVVAVLAGALIGREVEEYAREKGVRVYKY